MLSFPQSTAFSKRIPKQKFYDNMDISPALKKAFAEQIQAVYWRNKLAPATISLRAGERVSEIEVFEIVLNTSDLDEAILRQIDKSIPYHILFVLSHEEKVKLVIGHKVAAESDTNRYKVSRYFATPWVNQTDVSLQICGLDLDTVWESLITQIGGIQVEGGNTLDEQIRMNTERERIAKEIARLEKLARKEVQPRRKLELVQKINQLRIMNS